MIDCTTSLYLGLQHGSRSLGPWQQFSTGAPAALRPPLQAEATARKLAGLMGCAAGVFGSSTLHLFWDLFGIAAADPLAIYVDAGLYPIAGWGVERAAAKGAQVQVVPHFEPESLGGALGRAGNGPRPLLAVDGVCPACGRLAPIRDYLELLRPRGGLLVLDDTQALGIFGRTPGPGAPYGRGGGGALRRAGVSSPDIVVVSSLAKGLGVPIAVLASSSEFVARFQQESETRVHCSPPSIPAVLAARRALRINETRGDALRLRLARNVRHFRRRLIAVGLTPGGGLFPVQSLASTSGVDTEAVRRLLLRRGIRSVLLRSRRLLFILRADHTRSEIDRLADAILAAI